MLKSVVLGLLIIAIAGQNTCPYGLAGKTAVFTASYTHSCPLKKASHQHNGSNDTNEINNMQKQSQLFQFISYFYDKSYLSVFQIGSVDMLYTNTYEDATLSLPLRPPINI
ncbi:hypothetical protein MCHI_003788 [Candidatus Magnetoovum chiemensis]|nr:hypothetical protein MCHI_003788 [Candidatus Magnetoovum chiemensis]